MKAEDRDVLRQLLTGERLAALSVLVDGEPYVGLVPFAARADFGAVWIHASRLARHTAGLAAGSPFGLLIHAPDRPDTNPFLLPRITLTGTVQALAEGEPAYAEGRRSYVAKLPGSERNFQLGDFRLYELAVRDGRFVASFGRIHNLTTTTLREAAASP